MAPLQTETLAPDKAGLERASTIWKAGGLVAFPTETVYGLGADACNGTAVARIYEAKGRPQFNPLIIHVADMETAQKFGLFDEVSIRLAQAFWPGPLSLVVPVRKDCGLSLLVTAGLDTVAIRLPAHPLARRLLAGFGRAIAAPSANPSGGISPTTAAHVLDGLQGKIEAVVDGGPCEVGLESTIIGCEGTRATLLRPGGLPNSIIEAAIGEPLADAQLSDEAPTSPGQLTSHYAPAVQVRLNCEHAINGALWLGFGKADGKPDLNLSPSADLTEAAANLFAYLRILDRKAGETGAGLIAISPVPHSGLGVAINDRLHRAAAPREQG